MSAVSTELEALWGAPVGLAILDLDLRYVRVNDALAALHGLGAAEHVGKTVLEVLALQGPELAALLLRVRDGGAAGAVEVAGDTPLQPGVRCHWRVSCHPIREQGRVTGVATTVVDISAQKTAERALERADERLRAALTATDVGLWHWDPERDAVVGDRNFLRLFGLEAQDDAVPLAPFLGRIHAEDRPRVEAAIARALASGGLYDEVFRVVQAEHGQRWLHARGLVTLRTDGKPASFPGILLDVTRRFEASERLRESGERYRALLDSIDDGFCLIDVLFDAAGERAVDYRFVELNASFARQTGLVDAVGKTARVLVPGLDEFWYETYGRVARTGEAARFERDEPAMQRVFEVQAMRVGAPERRRIALLFRDITARAQSEAALKHSETRFKRLFATNLLGILFWDLDGGISDANDEFLRMVGHSRAELEAGAIDWVRMTPPEHRAQDERAVESLRRTGKHAPVEKEYLRKDGSRVWVLVGSAIIAGDSGVGFVLDISRQKQTEAALRASEHLARESEARFRALADNIAQLAWIADESGAIVWYNQRWFDYTGTSLAKMTDQVWQQVHHPEHADRVRERFSRHIAAGEPWEDTFPLRNASGEYRWFLSRAVPIRDDAGQVTRWFGTNTDITDQRAAEEAARTSQQLLRATMDNFPTVIAFKDLDGRFLDVNRVVEGVLGLRKDQIVGRTMYDFIPKAAADVLHRHDLEVLGTRRATQFEEVTPLPTGTIHHLNTNFPLIDAEDRLYGTGHISHDVTQTKHAEAALRSANERLEEADRRKDEFIAILAHELRNPLAPVRNAVHILKRVGPAEPRLERARDVIDRQVTHMARLIDDLLDVSRITRGKLALQTETCDLAAIARQTAEDYRSTLDAAGLSLVTTPAGQPLWVEGDPIRLAQIVGNFLNNAGRFTEKGGEVEVRTTLDMTDRCAVIEVVDTGTGIEPGLLSRLFDPFSQANQDLARTKGGLGLGLALTKGLAELHGGGVTAHSDGPGLGARFTLRIPLSKSRYEIAAPDDEQGSSGARLRILVVEDNHDAAEMLGELLELGGHQVQLAADGLAGVAAAQTFHPDVVISDIGLPGEMDGYAVARSLRAASGLRRMYLIALSGYADAAARQRSRDAGFDLHLAKPPDITLLERTLTEFVGR